MALINMRFFSESLGMQTEVLVAMPCVHKSFYADMKNGSKSYTYVAK